MTLRVRGGRVLQPDFSIERADVRVDADAGTIEGVETDPGATEAGEADPDAADAVGKDAGKTLDAEGCLVIPGLVNAHTHVAMTLLRGSADDKPLDAWLEEDIWPVEAALEPADVRAGARLGIAEMIRSGTTAFADMYFEMAQVAEAVAETGMRALLGHGAITVGKDEAAAHADFETGLDFAREWDGAADGRITTMLTPHSLTTVGAEYYREYLPIAREAGLPVHVHANETADEVEPIVDERGKRPLVYADDLGVLSDDAFLAHCVHVDEREIDLLAERGAAAIHCPASNMKLASGMAPVQAMVDAGVTVGLGTDGAASNNDLDLFDEVRDAAMVGKLAADDASAVDAATAVELATAGGADAIGIDGGRIEPGANADLVVIDLDVPHLAPQHDLVSHLAYAARGSDVRHTVCDGRVLMRDREVLTMDVAAAQAEAEERAAAVLDRAGVA